MPNFARASSGSLTGWTDSGGTPGWELKISTADVNRTNMVANTTAGSDSEPTFREGKRFKYLVNGEAWLLDGSSNFVHLTDNAGSVSGSLLGRTSAATLEKNHGDPLDVTAATDTAPTTVWDVNLPIFSGGAQGFLQGSETLIDESSDPNASPNTLTLPMGGSMDLSASMYVASIRWRGDFRGGGPIRADFQFRLSGPISHSGDGTPFEQQDFSATLDLDNGKTMTGTLLIFRLRTDLDYRKGGPVPFEFDGVFTGDVSFS